MSMPYRYVPFVSELYRFGRRQVRSLTYSGQAVFCNVCHKSFSRFIGNEDGVCPYCNSATRHRFLVSMLTDVLANPNEKYRTLFFAPDWGVERWLNKRPHKFSVITADLFAPNVDLKLDITKTNLAHGSFEVVLCSHVLEHVRDDSTAMKEMRRLLNPNGVLFLQIPINWESERTDEDLSVIDPLERQVRFGQFDHVRLYGRDLMDRLEAAGFSVTAVRCKDKFDDAQMKKYGLWNDVIFICRPSA